MYVRTTNLGVSDTLIQYMLNASSKYNELSVEASSGKKVAKPSDDAVAATNILKTSASLDKLNGYLSTMSTAQTELNTLDDSLTSLTKAIQNATDLATQASNGTYSTTDLQNIKSQVDSILSSVIDTANTQYNGKYIFSGTATSTQTYTTDATTGAITYQGSNTSTNDYQRTVAIADGVTVPLNAAGDKLFGSYVVTTAPTVSNTVPFATGDVAGTTTTTTFDASGNTITTVKVVTISGGNTTTDTTVSTGVGTGIIGTLKTLSNALAVGDNTTINASLDKLSNCLDTATSVQTQFASISNRFQITENSDNTAITQLKEYKSNLEEADLSSVLSDLATQKVALDATYQVTSQTLGMSLLKYL